MQHDYNPDGTRNRDFRPYIYAEETTYETNLYDPFRSVNYGLYSRGVQPGAIPTQLDYVQYMKKIRETHNARELPVILEQQHLDYPQINTYNSTAQPYLNPTYTARVNMNGNTTTMYKNLYAL